VLSRRALVGLLATLAFGALAPAACKSPAAQKEASATPAPTAAVVVDTGERQVSFRVELARTEAEREQGLMYRQKLDADAGMLFLFERSFPQTFWMKNTLIPLDMLFITSDHKIAGIVANAEPLTLTTRGVGKPSQFVLEINGGLSAKLGIREGQAVQFRGVDGY
jgi:uncharacterized membrane protein (UPF0127 family)